MDMDMDGGGGNDFQSTIPSMEEIDNHIEDSEDDPPHDDVCPICLEDYSLPCKGNCGHWFCSNCILQYWTYKGIIRPANCPICKQKVIRFTHHEASLQNTPGEEVASLLKRIEYYNDLHDGGISGFFLKMKLGFPFLIWSFLTVLTEPDRRVRVLARTHRVVLLVGCICNIYRVGIAIMDSSEVHERASSYYWVEFFSAFTFCVALLIGLCRMLWLRLSVWLVERRLRQLQAENARLRARLRELLIANGAQRLD